jgi:hypothetical protein
MGMERIHQFWRETPPLQLGSLGHVTNCARENRRCDHAKWQLVWKQLPWDWFFFFGGGSATPCASPPPRPSIFSRLFFFGSTALLTGMTGTSLHTQWPLTLRLVLKSADNVHKYILTALLPVCKTRWERNKSNPNIYKLDMIDFNPTNLLNFPLCNNLVSDSL